MAPVPQRRMTTGPVPPPVAAGPAKTFTTSRGPCRQAWKMGIYGEPGAGKSTLASLCRGAVFADIENSMMDMDVERVMGIDCWADLRAWVQAQREPGSIRGIDSMSLAEDWATEHVLKTKKGNDGTVATTSIEDFKFKAGSRFVADEFRLLLSDIEASFRAGVSWIMIAHDKVDWVRNPDDKDYRTHQPDLLDTKDVSSRADWIRFCDHVALVARDIAVVQGKASGGYSRTIYMDGAASRTCKMRGLPEASFVWPENDTKLWDMLGVK